MHASLTQPTLQLQLRNQQGQPLPPVTILLNKQMAETNFDWQDYGFVPWQPNLAAVLDVVVDGHAAAEAGLLPGDEIIAFNDTPVQSWHDLVNQVQASAQQVITLEIRRGQHTLRKNVLLNRHQRIRQRGI